MVGYLGPLGGGPTLRVLGHRLFARAWITRDGGGSQGTTVSTYSGGSRVVRNVASSCEESGGAQW
eukprot:1359770-Pleurochrysis_carterae.AAC.1